MTRPPTRMSQVAMNSSRNRRRSPARDCAMRSTTCCGVASTPSGPNVGASGRSGTSLSREGDGGAARRPRRGSASSAAYCAGASVRSSLEPLLGHGRQRAVRVHLLDDLS